MDLSVGYTEEPSAFNDLLRLFVAVFEGSGMGGHFSARLDESFRKAGLENVTLKKLELPLGKKMADESLRQMSIEPFKVTIPVLVGAAKGMMLLDVDGNGNRAMA